MRDSFTAAQVSDGTFRLSLRQYRIEGKISPNGDLTGDDSDNNVTFKGEISGPMFGRMFSGTITDGKCNPYVELVPEQSRK